MLYDLSALKVTSVDTFILKGGAELRFAYALCVLFCLCEFRIHYLQTRGAELPLISNSDKTKGVSVFWPEQVEMMVPGRIDITPDSVGSSGYMNIDADNKWFLSRMELGCVIAVPSECGKSC